MLLNRLNVTFITNYPKKAAIQFEEMANKEAAAILEDIPINLVETIFYYLSPSIADMILLCFSKNFTKRLLISMEASRSTMLLSRLDPKKQTELLSLLPKNVETELKEMLSYPDESVGKLMDTKVIAFNKDMTVSDAIRKIKQQKKQSFHYLFLLDDKTQLCGQVNMQEIALASENQTLASLSKPIAAYASVFDGKNDAIHLVEKYKLRCLPVVNSANELIGIINEHHLMRVIKEDVAADIQKMVGVSKDESALSNTWFSVKKRLPWLQINLLTAFLAAAVVGLFENTIAKYTALAILLPIAAGQSGNTGAQALAVTMRGLTLREITIHHWLRVMLKEFRTAFINGIAIAITCGLGVYIWSSSFGLSFVIALAMIVSMITAAVSGALVPILLKRFGHDPALSSSIILTTITDIAGFLSFLGIASLLSFML